MAAARPACRLPPPKYRVGHLLRKYGPEYQHHRHTTPRQCRVIESLSQCRTEELGGFVARCDSCEYRRVIYNPCRDRHCPSCEGQAATEWLQQLQERLLPGRYFHVVFTLPKQLRWLAFENAKLVYGLMLRCAGETLVSVGRDPKYLGGLVGVTAILHTWRRDLHLHPHVHCVVTGGGLDPAGERWIESLGEEYLFPNALLAARFRNKLLNCLARAAAQGKLRFGGRCRHLEDPSALADHLQAAGTKKWLVYSKRTFGDKDHLLRYLARYTHRVGLSDRRIRDVTDDHVTFETKNGETTSLHAFDFVSRFLLHVLPHGFVKIRHYGLLATGSRPLLEAARALLMEDEAELPPQEAEGSGERPTQPCPECMFGELVLEEFPPLNSLPRPET